MLSLDSRLGSGLFTIGFWSIPFGGLFCLFQIIYNKLNAIYIIYLYRAEKRKKKSLIFSESQKFCHHHQSLLVITFPVRKERSF